MKNSKSALFKALAAIENTPVMVLGDLMLDRYVWGKVDRISPEAPVPVVLVTKTEDRLGGAGNVVNNLCCLGAKVSVAGFIGADEEGKVVRELLLQRGVSCDGVIVDPRVQTTVKTRVIAHSQQVVRVDREEHHQHQEICYKQLAGWVHSALGGFKSVVVSDYGKGSVEALVMQSLQQLIAEKRAGLDICPIVVDPHPKNYGIYSDITVAKPNRREAEIATGIEINSREKALEAAKCLATKWGSQIVLITLGEDGMVLVAPNISGGLFLDTLAVEVFDVSGAGDTVTAVFAAALAAKVAPDIAGVLANLAAGIVVAEVGTAAIDLVKLRSAIDRLE